MIEDLQDDDLEIEKIIYVEGEDNVVVMCVSADYLSQKGLWTDYCELTNTNPYCTRYYVDSHTPSFEITRTIEERIGLTL